MDGGPEPASITQRRPSAADQPSVDRIEDVKPDLEEQRSSGEMVGS
jgi:hypothetical protein